MGRTRVLRLGSVLALASGLAIQLTSSSPIASGFDLSTMPPHLRAHVSSAAEMAVSPALMQSQQAVNYFPSSDECQGNLGSNIKVNQNCLNVSDADLQGRAQAQKPGTTRRSRMASPAVQAESALISRRLAHSRASTGKRAGTLPSLSIPRATRISPARPSCAGNP